MAIKREDERYSSDPLDELSGIVEHVERKKKSDEETDAPPGLRMKVTGDLRETQCDGRKRRKRD